MHGERKKILQYALSYEIEDVNTYAGYKGDLVVKIVSKNFDAIAEIQKYADSLDFLDVVVKQNPHLLIYELFCVSEDKEVYHVKDEKFDHHKHPKKDVWGNVTRE